MEMFSISAIMGNTMIPEPISEMISKNPVVVPSPFVMVNCGGSKSGRPAGILPVKKKEKKEK